MTAALRECLRPLQGGLQGAWPASSAPRAPHLPEYFLLCVYCHWVVAARRMIRCVHDGRLLPEGRVGPALTNPLAQGRDALEPRPCESGCAQSSMRFWAKSLAKQGEPTL